MGISEKLDFILHCLQKLESYILITFAYGAAISIAILAFILQYRFYIDALGILEARIPLLLSWRLRIDGTVVSLQFWYTYSVFQTVVKELHV